jgi:hypothetical protein
MFDGQLPAQDLLRERRSIIGWIRFISNKGQVPTKALSA